MTQDVLILGFGWYLVFVFSTVLHEASHAFVSWRLGDSTAYEGGQVTLDPTPHIRREPIGMVVVPLISFFLQGFMIGWASAPYNPMWAYSFPRRSALMALAGPTSNLLLVVVSGILIRLGVTFEFFVEPAFLNPVDFTGITVALEGGFLKGAAMILSIFFSLNLILFLFNLLPVPPLDGSGIVPLILPTRVARKYLEFMWQPMFSLIGIIVAWNLFRYVYFPVAHVALKFLYVGN